MQTCVNLLDVDKLNKGCNMRICKYLLRYNRERAWSRAWKTQKPHLRNTETRASNTTPAKKGKQPARRLGRTQLLAGKGAGDGEWGRDREGVEARADPSKMVLVAYLLSLRFRHTSITHQGSFLQASYG